MPRTADFLGMDFIGLVFPAMKCLVFGISLFPVEMVFLRLRLTNGDSDTLCLWVELLLGLWVELPLGLTTGLGCGIELVEPQRVF